MSVQLHQNRFYYHLVECNQRVGLRILGPHPACDASVLANLNIYGDTSFVRQVHAQLVGDISAFYSADCSDVRGLISGLGGWIGDIVGDINQLSGFIQLDPDTDAGVLWGTIDYRLRGCVDNIRGDISNVYGDIYCHGVVSTLTGDISGLKNLDVSFLSGNATGIRCYQYPASVSGNIDAAMAASGYTDADREQGIDLQNLTELGWA